MKMESEKERDSVLSGGTSMVINNSTTSNSFAPGNPSFTIWVEMENGYNLLGLNPSRAHILSLW